MAPLGLLVLVAVAIGGLICGFYPGRMPVLGWIWMGVAAIYGVLSALLPERVLRKRLSHRAPLSFDEVYLSGFQHLSYPRALVEDVWNELARDLGLDASRLRPSDRFGEELSVRGFPLVDLSEALNARLKERLRNAKASPDEAQKTSSIKTLLDYVEFACRMESRRTGARKGVNP